MIIYVSRGGGEWWAAINMKKEKLPAKMQNQPKSQLRQMGLCVCVCVCVCVCIFLEFVHVVLCVCGVCVYIHNQVCVSFTRTQMYTECGSQIRVKYHFL